MGRLSERIAQVREVNAKQSELILNELREIATEINDDLIEIFEDVLNDVPGKLVDKNSPSLASTISKSKVWCGISNYAADLHINVDAYISAKPHLNKPTFVKILVDLTCSKFMEKYPEYRVRVEGQKLVVTDDLEVNDRMSWIDYFKRLCPGRR